MTTHHSYKKNKKTIVLIITVVLQLVFGVSCINSSAPQNETDIIENTNKAENSAYQEALHQNMSECDEMERRNKEIAQEARKHEGENEILQWLQGNWEWNGTIDGYRNSCRLGVSDDYAVLATPRGVLDQGKITIDFEDNTIHFGSTYINFDYKNGRLGDFSNGMYYRKMSRSSGSGSRSSHSSGSLSYSSTTFRTSSDVMAYVSSQFRNSVGNVITVKYDGLYSNGNQITNAVRVVRFEGSRATLSATSPYTQGTLYFTVDASRGTFTDGSGDVFFKQ